MLIEKIKTHNEVNGFVFSVVEFALIALSIVPSALYYLMHARVISGIIASGIVANALTVVAFGVRALVVKQRSIGILRWFDKRERAAITLRYPHLTRDTLIVAAATLIPFVVLLCIIYEFINAHRQRS